jgi:glycosyltransferase involved in cell wall biosynthesis
MKLLICTQKVDRNDPTLGFFHRWIEEFSAHCDKVIVVCLEKGAYALPHNVEVISLGKEEGTSRFVWGIKFLRIIVQKRHEYDGVFVHMNPEYVLLGSLFWRAWGKKIVLWYTHKQVNVKLRLATLLTNKVATASKESFRINSKKKIVLGHGIDTDFFLPDTTVVRGNWILSVGRLMPSKRHDLAIEAAARAGRKLHIVGEGPERKNLESLAQKFHANVHFLGGLTQAQLRDEYRKAAFLIHTSETGSMDKIPLEALATDVAVITTSDVYRDFPVHTVAATPEAIMEVLGHTRESYDRVSIIRGNHSLQNLIPRLLSLYA